MKKVLTGFVSVVFVGLSFLFVSSPVQAANTAKELLKAGVEETAKLGGNDAGFTGQSDLAVVVGNFIGQFLGLLGIVIFGFVLYAGFLYFTSGGDPKRTQKSKDILKSVAIGLVFISLAYALTLFVVQTLSDAATAPTNAPPSVPPPSAPATT